MSKAFELFTAIPKCHNCAQAVVVGAGQDELNDEMKTQGGGNAPAGMCGALYAAMLLNPDKKEQIKEQFVAKFGSDNCKVLKRELHVPCAELVDFCGKLTENK